MTMRMVGFSSVTLCAIWRARKLGVLQTISSPISVMPFFFRRPAFSVACWLLGSHLDALPPETEPEPDLDDSSAGGAACAPFVWRAPSERCNTALGDDEGPCTVPRSSELTQSTSGHLVMTRSTRRVM